MKKTKKPAKKGKVLKKKPVRRAVGRKQGTVLKKGVTKKKTKKTPVAKIQKPILKPIGQVTHYFPHVKAGVVKVTKGTLAVGDTIHLKGHTTDFKQKVTSLQLDHQPIQKAERGQEVGFLVKSRVRQHDLVYKL